MPDTEIAELGTGKGSADVALATLDIAIADTCAGKSQILADLDAGKISADDAMRILNGEEA